MAFPIAGAVAGGLGSLLGGLFGGGGQEAGQLSPEQQQLYNFIFRRAKAMKAWGKSAALSSPDERQALAAARGSAGELLRSKREQGYAALGNEGSPAIGDFLGSLAGGEVSALSNIDFNALQQALTARRDARYGGAAQIAAMAAGPAAGQRYGQEAPVDLGGIFGNLAGMIAQNQAAQARPTDLRPITGVQQNNVLAGQAGGSYVGENYPYYRRPGAYLG